MIAHCLFEQSGTFKNAFKKLGVESYDYDILDDYGQTDYKVDLFAEIEKAYGGGTSIFDKMTPDDVILAFFPCTRFETKIQLMFRGMASQQQNWSDMQKLEKSMELHKELHRNYMLISQLVCVCINKNLKLVIENPYTQPHYLTNYWCIHPSIIDKDRTLNGDYMKKPTQFFFVNAKPKDNIVLEPIEYVPLRVCDRMPGDTHTRQVMRSEIHPQYAERFIKKYIIDYQTDFEKVLKGE